MNAIKNALAEAYSMFVDDPAFVGLVLAWVAAVYLGLRWLPPHAAGPILFLGLGALLLAFTLRRTRRSKNG